MAKRKIDPGDSLLKEAGSIPGAPGEPAFTISRRSPSPIPILIAVPHAGRKYPPETLAAMRDPAGTGLRLEDRLVDQLAQRIADVTGAGLVIAQAPRAMIDLNRAPEDMDWEMLVEGRPEGVASHRMGRRTRGGLGLVPRRLHGMGEIWKGRMARTELDARLEGIHAPYHAMLQEELVALRERWGSALLIDFHSMPPLGPRHKASGFAEFVIGDRFGSSCSGALCAAAFDHFAAAGRRAAHNRPYAGGYALDRHASPSRGIHCMQIEVCRAVYLDEDLRELGADFEDTAGLLAALVRRLADEMAGMSRPHRLAAE